MASFYHVTSSENRESIQRHGLDWTHMSTARGIAGSSAPEEAGIFLCFSDFEADFFVTGNNTGGPVDVWAVDGVDRSELVETPDGFFFLPRPVPASQVRLFRKDIPERWPRQVP